VPSLVVPFACHSLQQLEVDIHRRRRPFQVVPLEAVVVVLETLG